MNRRSLILLLGTVLVLLLGLLWSMPSEAQRAAWTMHLGMTWQQVDSQMGQHVKRYPSHDGHPSLLGLKRLVVYTFGDGSTLGVTLQRPSQEETAVFRVTSIETAPPPPAHPLTCLRRTLARALPFLGE